MADADQYITIGTWTFGSPCCILEQGYGIHSAPSIRGEDRTIPGVNGEAVRPRRLGPVRFPIVAVIAGDIDRYGNPIADPRRGLASNIAAMRAALLPAATDPLRTLVYGIDGVPVLTADQYFALL